MYVITPCSRPDNLKIMIEYMDFDKIDKWIIVHDTKFSKHFVFNGCNDKILELQCPHGTHGIAQRNMGISQVPPEGLVYFLDDDNIIQPQFWEQIFDKDSITTFDTMYKNTILKGNNIKMCKIDTCQFVVPRKYCCPWYSIRDDESASDGVFIENVVRFYSDKHVYVPKILSDYNVLRK